MQMQTEKAVSDMAASESTLTLESLRKSLIRQEDTIIFSLIERAKYPINSPAYGKMSAGISGSMVEYIVKETEALSSKAGRYESPEEHPFFPSNLPSSMVPPLNFPQVLHPAAASININKTIWDMYFHELLPLFAVEGDDGNYVPTIACDLHCLQALSRRIHYGKFVAEVKFRDAPEDYGPAIRNQDKATLMKLLTFERVEEMVKRRVEKKSMVFGQDVCLNENDNEKEEKGKYKVDPSIVSRLYVEWVSETHAKEIEVLKEQVRSMLMAAECKAAEKMNLIDTIERLGMSYHFEKEIEEQLKLCFNSQDADQDYDLCTIATHFRIFRQHGYNISCSIFNKFKDSNGKFEDTLTSDIKGMLSLYEATHLRVHGENVLEDALAFTIDHLKSAVTHVCPSLAKEVTHALEQPLHKGMTILESRHYISVYQEEPTHNEALLRLAKLELNQLQLLHQQEICQISRWWKDLDLASKLPFARDRVVECYFWALGVYYEPYYSRARLIFAKTTAIISVIDDAYDSYGTLEELEIFKEVVQRWDISAIDHLPDYMKIIYETLLNLYEDFDEEMMMQGKSYAVYHAKEGMKELVRSYNTEAKWFIEGCIPPFDEYIKIALRTSTYHVLTITSFMGMGEVATDKAFSWLQNKPKIIVAIEKICRLMDDVATYEVETGRGQIATGIECYMKQHGVSKEEAMDELYKMVENAWKDLNEECLALTSISKNLLVRVLNLARVIEVVYQHFEDGYTIPEKMLKNHITALLVDDIPL